MLQAQAPIDNYIISVYKEPGKLKADNALTEKVENLVDIIKSRIASKGISYTCISLREELWDLRWEVLSQQQSLDKIFTEIKNTAIAEISISAYTQDSLEIIKAKCLSLYTKILSPIQQAVSTELPVFSTQDFIAGKNAYSSLKLVYSNAPAPPLETVIKWMESSLDFECSLVIASLVLSKDLIIESTAKNEIGKHLRDSIIHMAFYSAIMELWHPEEEDEEQYIRNVKILLADYELTHQSLPHMTIEDFRRAFAA